MRLSLFLFFRRLCLEGHQSSPPASCRLCLPCCDACVVWSVLHPRPLDLSSRDLQHFAVGVLQPINHRDRQSDGADIKRSIAHEVVSAQFSTVIPLGKIISANSTLPSLGPYFRMGE